MRCLAVCLSVGLLLIPASAQDKSSSASAITIIPAPRHLIPSPGTFRISASTRIILGDRTSREDVAAVEALNEELILHGASALKDVQEKSLRSFKDNVIYIGLPDSRRGKDVLARKNAAFSDAMREEGYILAVDKRSGRTVYDNKISNSTGIFNVVGNMEKKTVDFIMQRRTITLTFTDKPLPPPDNKSEIKKTDQSPLEKIRGFFKLAEKTMKQMFGLFDEDDWDKDTSQDQ